MRSTAAFTLLELLISIAMLGLFAGIALPNFTALIHRQQLNQAASQLADAVRETKTLALAKNMALKFVVVAGPPAVYCITAAATCDNTALKSDRLSDQIAVDLEGGFGTIPFDTHGIVDTITLVIVGTDLPRAILSYPGSDEGVTRTVFLTSRLGKLVVQ